LETRNEPESVREHLNAGLWTISTCYTFIGNKRRELKHSSIEGFLNERELVKKILQGDEKAKASFYVTYRDRLYRDCVYLLGYLDPEAEDVLQETFITAFEKLPQFEFRSSLSTWLTQICILKCHNRYRQRTKTVNLEHSELEILLQSASLARQNDRELESEKQRKLRIIGECLENMCPECREIIQLREQQEKSYIEIGRILKIPLGTVMSRLSRCKKTLKVIVEQFVKEG
jgi:RNA polymerase sigma-70 factor (ECF subfamily)